VTGGDDLPPHVREMLSDLSPEETARISDFLKTMSAYGRVWKHNRVIMVFFVGTFLAMVGLIQGFVYLKDLFIAR